MTITLDTLSLVLIALGILLVTVVPWLLIARAKRAPQRPVGQDRMSPEANAAPLVPFDGPVPWHKHDWDPAPVGQRKQWRIHGCRYPGCPERLHQAGDINL